MKRRLLYVEWVDSFVPSGAWREPPFESHDGRCRSIGWVIQDDETWLGIAGHIGSGIAGDNSAAGIMLIPKVAIQKKKRISI